MNETGDDRIVGETTGRGEEYDVESLKSESSAVPVPFSKPLCFTVLRTVATTVMGVLLLLSNMSHIYTIVTWESKQQCITTGIQDAKRSAPFVWLTSWVLWLSTTFFVWYHVRLYLSTTTVSTEVPWTLRCLFQVTLCWSVVTVVAYTASLILTPPDPDAVDTELCLTFSDSIIQKSQPHAMFWLVMDRIFNLTAHYLCGSVLLMVYLQGEIAYDISRPYCTFFAVILAISLGLVDTFHAPVYDVDNIWWCGLGVCVGTLGVHGILWHASNRWIQQASHKDDDDKSAVTDECASEQEAAMGDSA